MKSNKEEFTVRGLNDAALLESWMDECPEMFQKTEEEAHDEDPQRRIQTRTRDNVEQVYAYV